VRSVKTLGVRQTVSTVEKVGLVLRVGDAASGDVKEKRY
jgi:hypothetical protein